MADGRRAPCWKAARGATKSPTDTKLYDLDRDRAYIVRGRLFVVRRWLFIVRWSLFLDVEVVVSLLLGLRNDQWHRQRTQREGSQRQGSIVHFQQAHPIVNQLETVSIVIVHHFVILGVHSLHPKPTNDPTNDPTTERLELGDPQSPRAAAEGAGRQPNQATNRRTNDNNASSKFVSGPASSHLVTPRC